nr:uncharacterized protein LOC108080838 [Drosophila kikkawai]
MYPKGSSILAAETEMEAKADKADQSYPKEVRDGEEDGQVCTCRPPDCGCPHCIARSAFKRLKSSPRTCRDLLEGLTPRNLIFSLTSFTTPNFMQPATAEDCSLWRPWDPMPGSVRLIRIRRSIAIASQLFLEQLRKSNQPSSQIK